jgi:hypothetical protein
MATDLVVGDERPDTRPLGVHAQLAKRPNAGDIDEAPVPRATSGVSTVPPAITIASAASCATASSTVRARTY